MTRGRDAVAQSGPGDLRRVLHQMRRVMAAEGAAQDRLNQLVRVIAAEMVAEVCSVYVVRAGEVLELFATEGLKLEAVHRTRLRVDEGLVGTVAATAVPLSLTEAQAHPKFAYRPETGEEIHHSFLGVPILRGGRVRGVLVIQNRVLRRYAEDEVEALEIIATVLAELIAGGDLVPSIEQVQVQGNALLPHRLVGVRVNGGIAMGEAVLHQPRIPIPELLADDPAAEHVRLAAAVTATHRQLDALLARADLQSGGEHRDILDAYRMFAEDQGWLRRIREAIDSGLTAEAAVQKVEDDTRARMNLATDPYLRERLYDLEDQATRLLQHLAGGAHTAATEDLPAEFVLIARRLGPAELLDYDPRRIRALVLEQGSSVSHVAIVARTLDIPVVAQIKDVLSRVDLHDSVIVDGDNGLVFLRAGEDVQQMAAENIAIRRKRREAYALMRDLPAVTKDGVAISLQLNAGLLMDLAHLEATGAEGVGLFRTEIPFMVRPEMPNVEVQTDIYRTILQQSGGRPVRFRTLDIGGDKKLPYLRDTEEDNPAMGWRALRLALDRPSLLRRQLRALLRASAGRALEVMFPMVAEVAEFAAALARYLATLAGATDHSLRHRLRGYAVDHGIAIDEA